MISMRHVILAATLLVAVQATGGAAEPAANANAQAPFGLTKRTPLTTSNFRGRPEPPPLYRAERLYPQLGFEKTTVISSAPGTDRFFVGEQSGKIYSLPGDRNATKADLFLDTSALVEHLNKTRKLKLGYQALYGLTFDPDFAKNRYCYVCYVVGDGSVRGPAPDGTRVSRLRVTAAEPPQCELDSEELIISWRQGGHNGGCLKFGPDGCLYISSGDGGEAFPPDGLNSGQDMTTLLAKIMRIDVRRAEQGRAYAIPADNPFVNVDKTRPETWAYGLRNPWKMSFDRSTGDLWVGDVGWELWELIYRVNRGDNFGWSIVEGSQQVHTERLRGPTPIVPPTMEIPHTEGASITGGFVYRGKKFPELVGTYVFGDWETRRIWGAKIDGTKLGERFELIDPTVRIVDFAEDHAGELYLLDHESGAIFGLTRNTVTADTNKFPRKLSETGLFKSVAAHEPAAGVLPFSINTEQFSDNAAAERFIGVPGNEPIQLHAKAKGVPGSQFSRATDYQPNTVLLKTLSLDCVQDQATNRRRIETQAL
ncbi:MAG: PQQ-dependent sugar dehydrogenase, partial [Planctomycetia bacterium]|nr:PQQ-dependent sugar dehydrogenase [Planctomycetia bacterium]